MNETHDPSLTSWVTSAVGGATDFPIQNLPFGVFARPGERARVGVAIGDRILDVAACSRAGLFEENAAPAAAACDAPSLNTLMALGAPALSALRLAISRLLRASAPQRDRVEPLLVRMRDAVLMLPADVGDYTDFYASVHHATNVGSMFRPDNPLLPNYKWMPIGYHGRASSLVPSGTAVRRPVGQTKDDASATPSVAPSKRLDYELEVGALIGPGNALGMPIAIADAEAHVFGLCLVNDWSARDIQTWEYQPLGPFLAKSFATTVSPWVVTLEALEPYRLPAFARPASDPAPLPYLDDVTVRERGGFAITLEVWLRTAAMRKAGLEAARLSQGDFAQMYWTVSQLVTHHASNGCNLRPGDLLASGTVSGPSKDSRGCLLELTWRGSEPVTLPNGELRRFLLDGDEVILRGWCERPGAVRIGFGECAGIVEPAWNSHGQDNG